MTHLAFRALRVVFGVLVVLFGIAELFLPGPGLLFIALGLGILSLDIPAVRRLRDRAMARLREERARLAAKRAARAERNRRPPSADNPPAGAGS